MSGLWRAVKDVLQIVVLAFILSFVLRTYIVEARQIPSGSMQPTLQIGDRLMVDKIIFRFSAFKRGDIVIFKPTPAAKVSTGADTFFIKRIIGLPGDELTVAQGKVYINGRPLDEPYEAEPPEYTYGPREVPDGMLFVMGDNRNNSADSHVWGFLPAENVKGKAFMRFWPLNRMGKIDNF